MKALYDRFEAAGLQYGPGYRTLSHAWSDESKAVSRLRGRAIHECTLVHPADLDDALGTGALIESSGANNEAELPFAVDSAMLHGGTGKLWAVRRLCLMPS